MSGSGNNTIKLWDAQTGAELRTLEGHSGSVWSVPFPPAVAFSPDGRRIMSGSVDNTIKLWDAQTGAELRTLEGHSHWVDSVASGDTHIEHNQGSQISVENSWVY
ncbi:WD40 repeat-like protein [Aspergillus steynii IBT 23096]|uniref:WD40 repeat-like protein n=1 Tax=Aspergillus steynii IBT 23096 TaxID=1392250 RepID=A0A2I2G4N3_9EURO|nr:WD40 repeat-like protein [Aspergillus steynii IBT 23096]PLB47837.1 WD40 repeat-like protein [Aspergillus steynii IBT 23096]